MVYGVIKLSWFFTICVLRITFKNMHPQGSEACIPRKKVLLILAMEGKTYPHVKSTSIYSLPISRVARACFNKTSKATFGLVSFNILYSLVLLSVVVNT